MKIVKDFSDYKILDMSNGKKLEQWGDYILNRPDPSIIWNKEINNELWASADATYERSSSGGGNWQNVTKKMPDSWIISYDDLKFNLKLMGFKHTGLFPEQAVNWRLIKEIIKNANREVKVLNLFAYTGAASIAALSEGASVVHVDSSKGMIEWAKENVKVNGLNDKPIRFIVDDVIKFVKREKRRGNKYDIIIMDPPTFGRGTSGEIWNLEDNLFDLVNECSNLLTDDALLFLINSYTTGVPKTILENILQLAVNEKISGSIESYELGLPMKDSNLVLPCGMSAKWTR